MILVPLSDVPMEVRIFFPETQHSKIIEKTNFNFNFGFLIYLRNCFDKRI